MADETPVAAAAEQPEPTVAADKESENVTSANDKPSENAIAPDDQKDSEAQADKADEPAEATESKKDDQPATDTNGAPAEAETKNPKDRRRSSGVTDKKLNRKKSQTRITQLDAKPGDYYLARLRSYAPWPAIICDEDMLPNSLLDSRPVTAAQQDGTFRADYADDGKRAHERTYPVMFFETNEFAWITNTSLTPLDPAECKEVSEKNKAKSLLNAYKVASEGHDLAYFKGLLADHQAALQQEMDEIEAEEEAKAKAKAEKAEKAASKKTKRKSKGAETDVEMEDADEPKKPKSATKKRKKDAETDGEAEKPAKTPKTATKLKLSTPKAPTEAKQTPASKTKKAATKKGKAAAEEDTGKESKQSEKQIDPEELKKKKEKEVLFLRHKLQKGFISRDQPPQEEEMATMSTYFDKLEKHVDLEVSIIRSTKINKVLKMIVRLNSIPCDEQFNFRKRSINILSNWKHVLDTDAPGASTDKEDKPSSNGAQKDESGETPKVDTEEEKELENKASTEDTPMPDAAEAKPEAKPEEEKPAAEDEAEKPAEEKPVEASA